MRKLSLYLILIISILHSSCIQEKKQLNTPEIELQSLLDSSRFYIGVDFFRAREWGDSLMKVAQFSGDTLWMIKALTLEGHFLSSELKFSEALKECKLSLQLNNERFAKQHFITLQNIGAIYLMLGHYDSASIYIDKIFKDIRLLDHPSLAVTAYNSKGELEQFNGNFQEALKLFYHTENLIDPSNEEHINLGATMFRHIANILEDQLSFDKSLEYYEKSIEFARKGNNKRLEAYSMISKSNLFRKVDEVEKAEQILNVVKENYLDIGDPQILITCRTYDLLNEYKKGNHERANYLFKTIELDMNDENFVRNKVNFYSSVAKFWQYEKKTEKAFNVLIRGLHNIGFGNLEVEYEQPTYAHLISEVSLSLDLDNSEKLDQLLKNSNSPITPKLLNNFLKENVQLCEKSKQWNLVNLLNKGLAKIEQVNNNPEKAIYYLSLANAAADSSNFLLVKNSADKLMVMDELLRTQRVSFKKDEQIRAQLNAQQKKRNLYLFMGILSLLSLGGIIYFIRQNKIKTKLNSALQKKNDEIATKNRIIEKDQEKINTELDQKKKLLIKETLYKDRINELAKAFQNSYREYEKTGDIAIFNNLADNIRLNEMEIIDSDDMMMHFTELDSQFINQIKKLHEGITDNDLKHIAYIRMNLNSKEVAQILGISSRSVESARYRLKKKLNLDNETSLNDYILSL